MSALSNRTRQATFLCYHSVVDDGPPLLSLPVGHFEQHLRILREQGWATGTTQGLRDLAAGRRPERPLAYLTFDDGFVDNHAIAAPMLREYGFGAMIFVVPPLLDEGAPLGWPEVDTPRRNHPAIMRSMTWRQVEELAEAGVEIGSHTLTHPHLEQLDPGRLEHELVESRRAIAERLGRCETIAYPFGGWSPAVADAAARAGYEFAFTLPNNGQLRHAPLSVPRLPIDHRDDARRFGLKLSLPARTGLLSPLKAVASTPAAPAALLVSRPCAASQASSRRTPRSCPSAASGFPR
jgi:peptidoglycan/xylan/chitin deacetylase (PgdA/CDA1 family)